MKKSTLFLFAIFAAQVFSEELICAPSFEIIGLNAGFGISSIRVLQGTMETKMNARQLVAPSAIDSVFVTDSESHQISWARNRSCSHLLQTTLTRLGETVQVNARLMDINSGDYVFKKAYNANSPDDLHPIFQQLGNTLQDQKFASIETIYDIASSDAKTLKKKKTSNYLWLYSGGSYYSKLKELYNIGIGVSLFNRTLIGETVMNIGFNADESYFNEFGFRILYPFSDKNSTFYIGGGGGFVYNSRRGERYRYYDYPTYYIIKDYGLLFEASAGYLMGRTSNLIFRLEAYGNNISNIINKEQLKGGGARLIFGIVK